MSEGIKVKSPLDFRTAGFLDSKNPNFIFGGKLNDISNWFDSLIEMIIIVSFIVCLFLFS